MSLNAAAICEASSRRETGMRRLRSVSEICRAVDASSRRGAQDAAGQGERQQRRAGDRGQLGEDLRADGGLDLLALEGREVGHHEQPVGVGAGQGQRDVVGLPLRGVEGAHLTLLEAEPVPRRRTELVDGGGVLRAPGLVQPAVEEGQQGLPLVGYLAGEVGVEQRLDVALEGPAGARVVATAQAQELLGLAQQALLHLAVEVVEQGGAQQEHRRRRRQQQQPDQDGQDAGADAARPRPQTRPSTRHAPAA
jgi:hypothetical protein